jgi:uncharacterized membrane protein
MKKLIFACCLTATAFITGCYYDKEATLYGSGSVDCNSISAKFGADIAPMIQSKCAIPGCHNASGASGGRIFENYTQIKAAIDRIRQRAIIEKTMPKNGSLTSLELAQLQCWIDSGAPNN